MPWDSVDRWRDEDGTPPPGIEPVWPALPDEIMSRVEAVRNGRTPDPQTRPKFRRQRSPRLTASQISEAEEKVLAGVARGLTSQEIADALHFSPETVKTHVKRVRERTGSLNSTHMAVRYVLGEFQVMAWRHQVWVAADPG